MQSICPVTGHAANARDVRLATYVIGMPRQPRTIQAGTTYHLISRFVDRDWFINTPDERELYLRLLGRALEDSDWRLMSYAVMSNHIHLGSVAGEQPLNTWIRRVHSPFADVMNRAYDRIGPLFVRGPKAYPVEPESIPHLLAYIHNNPVRAAVYGSASDGDWTSHRAYLGTAPIPKWLHVSEGLARAGFYDSSAFDAWVNDPARADTENRFTEEQRANAVNAARQSESLLRKSSRLTTAYALVAVTADMFGITIEQLRSSKRGPQQVIGRFVAVHSAVKLGLSGRAIAQALRISQQHVSELRRESLSAETRSLCSAVVARVDETTESRRAIPPFSGELDRCAAA
jgi:putative transposase